MSTEVSKKDDRYVISVDGQQAGFALFLDRDGRRIFHHTEIGDDFGGQGLGKELAAGALGAAAEEGMTVVPVCPFIAGYLERHPELAESTAKPTPDDLNALSAG